MRMEARGDEGQRRAKMGQGDRRVRQGTAPRRDTGWAEGWLRRSGGEEIKGGSSAD